MLYERSILLLLQYTYKINNYTEDGGDSVSVLKMHMRMHSCIYCSHNSFNNI